MTTTQTTEADTMSWNGKTFKITVSATIEASDAEEAQMIMGNLLAGRDHDFSAGMAPLTGAGSWAPEIKQIEEV
jgi:hypothetical protein